MFGPLADLMEDDGLLAPDAFWRLVRAEVTSYRDANPALADRFEATGLLGETFARYPLNGYRLRSGYGDLDVRPPVPVTGRMPTPLYDVRSRGHAANT